MSNERPLVFPGCRPGPVSTPFQPLVKLACLLFSFYFTCIAALTVCCPTKRLLRDCTNSSSSRQTKTLASSQDTEGGAEDRASARSNDLAIADSWRLNVNIRLGVAIKFAEGANTARSVLHTMAVVAVAVVIGCTGFLTSIMALSLAWLIPSVRKGHPGITENPRTRVRSIQNRAPHRTPKKNGSVPRPEPIRHISFDEPVPKGPSSAPVVASSYPRGRHALLPRCKSRSPQIGVVPLPPASAPIVADNSPLSSAETLAEAPQEVKRALSSRLTRALLSRGRQMSRTSTIGSNTASSSSVAEVSEFGERVGKVEMRSGLDAKQAHVTERGRFGFLKKSKTIQVGPDRPRSSNRPAALSLPSPVPFTENVDSSADSIPSPPPRNTDSPDPLSPPPSSTRSIHRRVSSTLSASSKLRIADKLCSRKEKDKGPEPKPKPARTQPYGPPYNWIPPTPGAWAVVEATEESAKTKRASVPNTDQTGFRYVAYHERERAGSMPTPLPAM